MIFDPAGRTIGEAPREVAAQARARSRGAALPVPIHLDVVIIKASLQIDGRQVLDRGRWGLDIGSPT